MDVLLIRNGVVENVICADSVARAQQFYSQYTCVERQPGQWVGPGFTTTDNVTFTPPGPAPVSDWRITRFAMLERFQSSEIIAINEARQGTGQNAAQMETLWQNLTTAAWVDLSDPRTAAMVNQLVTAGILTSARANTILTTPPAASEGVGNV